MTSFTNILRYLPLGLRQGAPQPLPTILFLHGAGERGVDIAKLTSIGLPRLCASFEQSGQDFGFPFQVIAPQLPDRTRWHWQTTLKSLTGLLETIDADPWTDRERFYLTGFSMGGDGAWALAARHPHRFAAVAPISGQNHDVADSRHHTWALPILRAMPTWISCAAASRVRTPVAHACISVGPPAWEAPASPVS